MEDMFKYIETLSLTKSKGIRLFNELCDEVKQFKESRESRELNEVLGKPNTLTGENTKMMNQHQQQQQMPMGIGSDQQKPLFECRARYGLDQQDAWCRPSR